ncbi:CopG family transcriptional regulator [Chlorobaculum sp. 24CR]|uniref:CopG family ribbon-helix-helix protein n=1 Tax=Chlorobaculum sp. 24CR TaxID=2508878 RepID=UPI00100A71FC|nr:CopG family ribbon-helix-helix protein [Chlorobaculum sp. 24CR]RXK82343.1 CopG family transcriptional regulator [Chlorobaculum sp. 24CR]
MNTSTKNSEQKEQISFRIASSEKRRIERLAQALNRDKTFVFTEAISHYLDLNEWQIAGIQEGLEDLEHGRVVSQEEIEDEWRRKSEGSVD